MPKTWIKIHIEFLDNPKVMTLNLALRGVWFTALGVAERYDHDGLLPPADRFSLMAHTDDETAEKAYAALAKKGLLDETPEGYRIHDWQEWQARKPSDEPEAVAARQAKWYAAHKKTDDLTSPNALGDVEQKPNAPNANKIKSEIKKREEKRREKRQPTVATQPQAAQRAMFGALSESFGQPAPGPEHERYEAAAKALITAGAEPSEIPHLCEAWAWINPGPPRVNSLAGQLTVLRKAEPRGSPVRTADGNIQSNLQSLDTLLAKERQFTNGRDELQAGDDGTDRRISPRSGATTGNNGRVAQIPHVVGRD
jgi:hypothetical protein